MESRDWSKAPHLQKDMEKGLLCYCCGVCFTKEHGCPVLCEECYAEEQPTTQMKRAYYPEA